MRKILRASVALVAIMAAGDSIAADQGGKISGGGGGGISGAMNDALQGISNSIGHALGMNSSQPTATKIGAVRDDATYDGVGAIGGGVGGNDPSGMGIGGGVQGNDPNDVSGESYGAHL